MFAAFKQPTVRLVTWSSAVVVTAAASFDLARLWATPTFRESSLDPIVDGGALLREKAQLTGDWQVEADGLALDPGGSASVTWKFVKHPADSVVVALWVYANPWTTNVVEVSSDGERFAPLLEKANRAELIIDLAEAGRDSEQVWLRLASRSEKRPGAFRHVVLDQVQTSIVERAASIPDVPVWFLIAILPIVAFTASEIAGSSARTSALVSFVLLAVLLVARFAAPELIAHEWRFNRFRWNPLFVAFAMSWSASLALAVRRGLLPTFHRRLGSLAVLAVLAFASMVRWPLLRELSNLPLGLPDASTVYEIAREMRHPYDTWVREPLWPCLVKVFTWIFGSSELSARYYSMAFGLALVWMTWRFARDYTQNDVLALLAATAVALHDVLISSASQAHRTELYALLLLAFTYYALVPSLDPRRRIVGLCIFASCLALTMLTSMLTVLALLGCSWWRHRIRPLLLALPVLAAAVVIAPNLAYNAKKFGHPTYFNTVMTGVWYRNYEFVIVKGTGCNGCPTREEFYENAYGGDRTTITRYIFGMHPFGEVVRQTARGYFELFLRPGSPSLAAVLGVAIFAVHLLWMVGLVILATTRWRELLIVPIISINALAFLVPIGIDVRLVAHLAPFAAIILALPLAKALPSVVSALRRFRSR